MVSPRPTPWIHPCEVYILFTPLIWVCKLYCMYTFHKSSLKQCFTICLRTEIILNSFSSILTTSFRRTLLLRSFTLAIKCRKIMNHPVKILPLKLLTGKIKKQKALHNMPTIYLISVLHKFCLNPQSQVMIKFAQGVQDCRLEWAGKCCFFSRVFEGVPFRLRVFFFHLSWIFPQKDILKEIGKGVIHIRYHK